MSEKDRFDFNDDMEFDSDTDGQKEYEDFNDPLDGFADYDDMSDYEDLPGDDSPAADSLEASERFEPEATDIMDEGQMDADAPLVVPQPDHGKRKRRRGLSPVGLGFLFTVSTLVAGVGIGGAILFAEGVNPATLWQPQNLLQVDQLLNFSAHPLNILYIVAMGVAFLALLGSFKMTKSAAQANERTREAEEMLDRVTALTLDKQEEWQSQDFTDFPPAEAFVIRTLGAWRLQAARQKRLMGVEGELHRLEKALNKNSRSDLTGRFDHPAVGRLADEMIRYFDGRDVAVEKLAEYENRDRSSSGEIVNLVQDSRQWNGASLDSLGVQCAALDDLAREIDDLARQAKKAASESTSNDGMTDIIEGIRQDLAGQPAAGGTDARMVGELNDLVDRGSKLAFQIAMEVARLGPRGERLLPMSQSLEDLTTGFRQLADRVNNRDDQPVVAPGLNSVHKKLETLAVLITQDDQAAITDFAEEIQDFGPAAARVSGTLNRVVDGFNQQEDRLVKVGATLSEMTGAEFDSSSIPREESSEAPVDTLDITRPPSSRRSETSSGSAAEVDPFVSSEPSFLGKGEATFDPDFSSSVLPAPTADSGADDQKAAPESLSQEGPDRFSLEGDPSPDMPLSADEEKVYDLDDFGASSVTEPESGDEEQVFDLSSFSASPLDNAPVSEPTSDSDEVFEMEDLGGSAMVQDSSAEQDEVFEMDDLGGAPLDAVSSDSEEEIHDLSEFEAVPVEEPVFDLADFGAKPMK